MALLDFRLRAGYLFLTVVIAHLVLISVQVNAKSGVPILESVTFSAFAEVQRATAAVVNGVRGVWGNYVALRGVRVENDVLRRDLANAQVQIQEERALADRSRSLEAILELRNTVELKTTAAQIIAGPRASRVQLLIDRNAAAGALIERSRAQGVAVGAADDRMRLDYVSETSDVMIGDTVVTSGIDGIYPKGFVIGTVDVVDKNGPAYSSIGIRPSVRFSTLEDVLVVITPPPSVQVTPEKPE
jgi:rod shape-determining protein MreC